MAQLERDQSNRHSLQALCPHHRLCMSKDSENPFFSLEVTQVLLDVEKINIFTLLLGGLSIYLTKFVAGRSQTNPTSQKVADSLHVIVGHQINGINCLLSVAIKHKQKKKKKKEKKLNYLLVVKNKKQHF